MTTKTLDHRRSQISTLSKPERAALARELIMGLDSNSANGKDTGRGLAESARMCIEFENYTHRCAMRTNIVIDDQLMAEALKASGYETKKEAVEQGLKLLVQLSKQQEIRKLRGKIKWEGDLDEMRSAR